MKPDYKNWIPKGMIFSLIAGTALSLALLLVFGVFGIGVSGRLRIALGVVFGIAFVICTMCTEWCVYAYRSFSYDGERKLSRQIIDGTASHITLPEGGVGLDIGCGSGILGIASLLLGAEYADMVDIDPNAVKIVTENADMNNIPHEKYEVMAGNILDDEKLHEKYSGKKYDVVEANIVADVIVALSPMVPNFIKDNGIFICSGIIDTRLDDVLKALGENGFEVLETKTRKDWCAVASRYTGR